MSTRKQLALRALMLRGIAAECRDPEVQHSASDSVVAWECEQYAKELEREATREYIKELEHAAEV